MNKDFNLPENSNFYRIRKVNSNYPITVKEIFHIPFNLRERVATQRFSIPGLPSLYLANSLFVAWEELGRPSDNYIQASRFCNNRELRLLDLANDIYQNGHLIKGNEAHGWQLLYYVMVWPLIAACSIKVPESDVAFKPEYIIPQLLLQWINKNELDGIKYSSTHINTLINRHVGHLYNLVIPVKTFNKSSGFCDELIKTFSVSNVVPMQINQFTDNTGNDSELVNQDVERIELIEGRSVLYSNTTFGKVEKYLNKLIVNKITNG
ncbi:RES domain-containing protein [Maribellus sp. CM-23]|uniref:RES domain-containing protein n=1 Tax=Maribellus sp. CM-23 TaxID=2781026 RepID=UPI001F2568F6|nr:RES domain-containing protein [Maribellus sp. CM-23]MCE4565157.1 RES domain-containing protein [Maribellus sp. CM-23]